MKERRTIYLLDGSAIDDETPDRLSLNENLYDSVKKPQIMDLDQIERSMNYLTQLRTFGETRYMFSIPEVIIERRAHLEILNEQHDLIRQAIDVKHKRKIIKKAKGSRRGYEEMPEEDELEELRDRLKMVRLYADKLTSFVKGLDSNFISISNLNRSEMAFHEWAYNRAGRIHPKPKYEVGKYAKLGDTLETDVRIIAVAMALSLQNPITVITRDARLGKTLRIVNELAGPTWHTQPRYDVNHIRDHRDLAEKLNIEVPKNNPKKTPEGSITG